jgi:hypothetical protein
MRADGLPLALAVLAILGTAAGLVRTLLAESQRPVDDTGDRRTDALG